MKVYKINHLDPGRDVIKNSSQEILEGGLVVYPTDTAYGIGVNATNEKAIEKLYRIKNRKHNKPTHVVVKDWEMMDKLTATNKVSQILFRKLMPGPITLILEKRLNSPIPNNLTGGLPTLGVRIPDYKITKLLSEFLNIPYTTPSANRDGEPTPYSIEEVRNVLDLNIIDIVLDAGLLPKNKPSTLVDLSGKTPKILREGPINKVQIFETLKINSF